MASRGGDDPLAEDPDPNDVRYPEFDHGDTLVIRWCRDGHVEFQGDSPDESIRAEDAVRVDRWR